MKRYLMVACRGILAVMTLMGSAASLWAVRGNTTIETDWTPNWANTKSSVASTTVAVRGIGFGWSVAVEGQPVQFSIAHTTRTYQDPAVAVASVTSPTIYLSTTVGTARGTFKALTFNPAIVTHGMNTGGTVHIIIDYGEPKVQ